MSEDSELKLTNRGNMFHWGSFQKKEKQLSQINN